MPLIKDFLWEKLKLELHPNKVFIKTIASGVDFLGWVNFPGYRMLRTTTKRRIIKRVIDNPSIETLNSYRRLLQHGNAHLLKEKIGL